MNTVLSPVKQQEQCDIGKPLLKNNYLSEFITKSEKQKVLENLGINNTIEWGEIGGYIEKQTDLFKKIKETNGWGNIEGNIKSQTDLIDYIESQLQWGNIKGDITNQNDLQTKLTNITEKTDSLQDQVTTLDNETNGEIDKLWTMLSSQYDALDNKITSEKADLQKQAAAQYAVLDTKINDTKSDLQNQAATQYGVVQTQLDNTLKKNSTETSTLIPYSNEGYSDITNIQEALDKALYVDLTISISASPNICELGDTLNTVTITWNYNKSNIKEQTLGGIKIDSSIRSYTLNDLISTAIVKVTGNDGTKEASGTATVNFYPGIYYGHGTIQPDTSSMSKLLQSSRKCSITINASTNEYIWILLPTSYGTPTFTVGGFSGGFQKADVINYKVTEYTVWKSDNHSLGNTTINIT